MSQESTKKRQRAKKSEESVDEVKVHNPKAPQASKWSWNLIGRIILGVAAVCFSVGIYVNYGHLLTVQSLKQQKAVIDQYRDEHPILAPLAFTATMVFIIGTNCPGATGLSIASGFLFPQPLSSICCYIGYVGGASMAYALIKTICGDRLRKSLCEGSAMFRRFQDGMRKADNFWEVVTFLVCIRYIAFFPFWFVNASCAIMSVGFWTFFLTTAIATVPGSVLYSTTGRIIEKTLETYDGELSSWDMLKSVLFSGDRDIFVVVGILLFCVSLPLILRVVCPKKGKTKETEAKSD